MNKVVDFLKYLIPFSFILFVTQYFVMQSLSSEFDFFYSVYSIYIFNVAATFFIYLLLIFVNKNFDGYTGFAFLGTSFVRMMAAVVFFIPLIKSNIENPIIAITTFFVPYFMFLIFEVYFAIRLINKL